MVLGLLDYDIATPDTNRHIVYSTGYKVTPFIDPDTFSGYARIHRPKSRDQWQRLLNGAERLREVSLTAR
jgi:hypothetical protein